MSVIMSAMQMVSDFMKIVLKENMSAMAAPLAMALTAASRNNIDNAMAAKSSTAAIAALAGTTAMVSKK